MKCSWGTGIAIVYALFVLGMLGAVFASRRHDPGLVQKDYYSLDLNYQDRLDRKQNAALLGDRLRIGYEAPQGVIAIQFPPELGARPAGSNCSARLRCPTIARSISRRTPEGEWKFPQRTCSRAYGTWKWNGRPVEKNILTTYKSP